MVVARAFAGTKAPLMAVATRFEPALKFATSSLRSRAAVDADLPLRTMVIIVLDMAGLVQIINRKIGVKTPFSKRMSGFLCAEGQ
jgi:hypothetical protein